MNNIEILKNINEVEYELENSHNGQKYLLKNRMFSSADFDSKLDFIDIVKLAKDTSIGLHSHVENEEIYFILNGQGEMFVNDSKRSVKKGDIIVNRNHKEHSLINNTNEELVVFIFQVSI